MLPPCCSAVACICLYFAYILYTLAYSSLYYLYNRAAAEEEQEEEEKRGLFFSLCFFLPFPLSLFLSISLSFPISFYIYFYISFSCFGSFFFSFISLAFSLSFPLSVSLSSLLLPPCCVLAASLLLAGITKRTQQSITCPCCLFAGSLLLAGITKWNQFDAYLILRAASGNLMCNTLPITRQSCATGKLCRALCPGCIRSYRLLYWPLPWVILRPSWSL